MSEQEKVVTPVEEVVETAPTAEVKASEEKAPRGERPRGDRRPPRGDRRAPREREVKEFEERVVSINRISKTVKGGRRLRFAAVVVIGDKKGRYGFGTGKAGEVPDAIKKAIDAAKKNVHNLKIVKNDTISHEVYGVFGACRIYLKPAPEGTGVIAGGSVRDILELAGIRNVYSKIYGSRSPINVIRACHNGISNLKTFSHVMALRHGDTKEGE